MEQKVFKKARRVEVTLPVFAFPYKDPEHPCPCQERPVELTHKICQIFRTVDEGTSVEKGDAIANIEVEKKTLELIAPVSGRVHFVLEDGAEIDFHSTICVIETTGDEKIEEGACDSLFGSR